MPRPSVTQPQSMWFLPIANSAQQALPREVPVGGRNATFRNEGIELNDDLSETESVLERDNLRERGGARPLMRINDPLVAKAKKAAMAALKHAYCPYSKFPVGAAVVTTDHKIVGGCNV